MIKDNSEVTRQEEMDAFAAGVHKPMEITEILYAANQEEWRNWLVENHAAKKEIWLVCKRSQTEKDVISYLHAVEEAICFGWIDSTSKKIDAENTAQRFSPRRTKSNWTELNKERARRLIQKGKMTEAGLRVLPDLSPEAFHISEDILDALQADVQTWENFQKLPENAREQYVWRNRVTGYF